MAEFLLSKCPTFHPTINVKIPKDTQSTDPNEGNYLMALFFPHPPPDCHGRDVLPLGWLSNVGTLILAQYLVCLHLPILMSYDSFFAVYVCIFVCLQVTSCCTITRSSMHTVYQRISFMRTRMCHLLLRVIM